MYAVGVGLIVHSLNDYSVNCSSQGARQPFVMETVKADDAAKMGTYMNEFHVVFL